MEVLLGCLFFKKLGRKQLLLLNESVYKDLIVYYCFALGPVLQNSTLLPPGRKDKDVLSCVCLLV